MDEKIHGLEIQYHLLENDYEVIRKRMTYNSGSYQLTAVNKISTMCKVLFFLKHSVTRSLEISKVKLNNIDARIKRLESKPRRRRKAKINPIFFTRSMFDSSFYFRTTTSSCKKNNLDCIGIGRTNHLFLSELTVSQRWRTYHQRKLLNGVRQGIVEEQAGKILHKTNQVYENMRTSNDADELDMFHRSFEKLKLQMERIKGATLNDLLIRYTCNVDWQRISELFRNKRFTPHECKAMWELVANPLINNREWSRQEDLMLNCLVGMHGFQDWDTINKKLNAGRTPFLCFSRYQQTKKPPCKSARRWTARENQLIRKIIAKGNSKRNFNSIFSRNFSDVSKKQLRMHLNHVQNHNGTKLGTFSVTEKFLVNLYRRKKYSYRQISQTLNRSTKQVYDLWCRNNLQSTYRKWGYLETRRLLSTIKYSGTSRWSEISKYLVDRTPYSCRHRYHHLKAKQPQLIERYMKKTPHRGHVKSLLDYRESTLSANKKNSLDKQIESYFVQQYDQNPTKTSDCTGVGEKVVDLLEYFNFDVKVPRKRLHELGQWLLNCDEPTIDDKSNFKKLFKNLCVDKKALRIDKNAKFSSLVSKTCPVLPPNKCTLYGVNGVQKNFENLCSSAGVDFNALWRDINSSQARNKNFIEAKLMWYQILKGLLYWPIKLNAMPVDKFL